MDDIDALLGTAADQVAQIRSLYQQSLDAQAVDPRLPPLIKNALENQRSALDYLAERIYRKHGNPGKAKAYYPVAKSSYHFPAWFAKNLPGVDKNAPHVRDVIRDRQWYRPGFDWLRHLHDLTIEQKHRQLTPQVRAWTTQLETDPDTGNEVRLAPDLPGASTEREQTTEPVLVGRDVQVGDALRAVVFVDWLFTKPPVSALGTLERIQSGLPQLIRDVRQTAGV
jgi:hypothetical protein